MQKLHELGVKRTLYVSKDFTLTSGCPFVDEVLSYLDSRSYNFFLLHDKCFRSYCMCANCRHCHCTVDVKWLFSLGFYSRDENYILSTDELIQVEEEHVFFSGCLRDLLFLLEDHLTKAIVKPPKKAAATSLKELNKQSFKNRFLMMADEDLEGMLW